MFCKYHKTKKLTSAEDAEKGWVEGYQEVDEILCIETIPPAGFNFFKPAWKVFDLFISSIKR